LSTARLLAPVEQGYTWGFWGMRLSILDTDLRSWAMLQETKCRDVEWRLKLDYR